MSNMEYGNKVKFKKGDMVSFNFKGKESFGIVEEIDTYDDTAYINFFNTKGDYSDWINFKNIKENLTNKAKICYLSKEIDRALQSKDEEKFIKLTQEYNSLLHLKKALN